MWRLLCEPLKSVTCTEREGLDLTFRSGMLRQKVFSSGEAWEGKRGGRGLCSVEGAVAMEKVEDVE